MLQNDGKAMVRPVMLWGFKKLTIFLLSRRTMEVKKDLHAWDPFTVSRPNLIWLCILLP